jgi:hypothetical protein
MVLWFAAMASCGNRETVIAEATGCTLTLGWASVGIETPLTKRASRIALLDMDLVDSAAIRADGMCLRDLLRIRVACENPVIPPQKDSEQK